MPESDALERKLQNLPDQPGVYLFKDRRGAVLYVGKAKSLRSRVRSYFQPASGDDRRLLPFLRAHATDVDTLVVKTEKEAFLLENSLIKRHRPRYNVRLVDDKTYLSLRLSRSHAFPRFTTVRRARADGSRYFGPYSSARAVRDTLKFVYRSFGIRSCNDTVFANRSRPCLYYQIGQCLAPCVGYVSEADYDVALGHAELLLAGRDRELVGRLRGEMEAHATAERFEDAARIRDRLSSIERTVEKQAVAGLREAEVDALGHAARGDDHVFVWLHIREGRVADSSTLRVRERTGAPAGEVLASVLAQLYESRPAPEEILVAEEPASREILEEVLSELRGRRVTITCPLRGQKRRLLDLATTNAAGANAASEQGERLNQELLASLQEVLGLDRPPRRIECFDISNIQGTLAVGSMVVAIDGLARPEEYRRYRIRTVEGADDYAMMREVLSRRLSRGLDEGNLPDLLVVDGGRGQLAIALSVAEEVGADDVAFIGLAKGPERNAGRETIHLPDRELPLALAHDDPRLHLLQRVRDEAHRFAITYHRQLRARRDRTSVLLAVPGLGPARTRRLLKTFGSVEGVRRASVAELREAGLSATVAAAVQAHLGPPATEPSSEPG